MRRRSSWWAVTALVAAAAVLPAAAEGGVDRSAPKAPSDLAIDGTSRTSLTLSWKASRDNRGVVAYDLFLDSVRAGSTELTTSAFTGLACSSSHVLGVQARDAAGNVSQIAVLTGSTAACDTTPPTAPGGLAATGATETSISLAWQASSDDDAVAGYDVTRDGVAAGATATTTFAAEGLACGETYEFGITARDPSGNRSAPALARASTAACPAAAYVSPDGVDSTPRWQHVAATYDGATVRLFVDGVEVSSTPVSGSMAASAGPLQLGGNAVFGEWYAGLVDQVRIYNRALNDLEILRVRDALIPDLNGLVAAYEFDEQAGSKASDATGNGHDGTLIGATWAPAGHVAGAVSFDGSDDLVTVADADALDLGPGMTLAAWVRPERPSGWRTILAKEGAGHLEYGLWASTDTDRPSGHVYVGREIEARGAAPLNLASCSRSEPCRSFGAAYHAAQGGIVEVADGVYGDQTLLSDPAKSADRPVVFRPAAGASVRAGHVVVRGSHVEFRDMRIEGGWEARTGADDVTFRNVSSANMFIYSASNVRVLGGEIGPGKGMDYDSQISTEGAGAPPPTNIEIRGVRFFNWFRPAGTDFHTECLQVGAAVNLVISGSRFEDCATHDIFIRSWGNTNGAEHPLRNITIENNFLDVTLDGFNTVVVQNDLGTERGSVVVRNNSSLQAMYLDGGNLDIQVIGNIIGFQQSIGCLAMTYRYNVIEQGDACGATDVVAPVAYVDRAGLDLHLAPGSAAIDRGDPSSYPAVDIDGDTRPMGGAPDAGADERS